MKSEQLLKISYTLGLITGGAMSAQQLINKGQIAEANMVLDEIRLSVEHIESVRKEGKKKP